jgi:UDP-N-acetyl-D-glucosamine dehydrogenase
MAACRGGFSVVGFDIDTRKTEALNAGLSYIDADPSAALKAHIDAGRQHRAGQRTQGGVRCHGH